MCVLMWKATLDAVANIWSHSGHFTRFSCLLVSTSIISSTVGVIYSNSSSSRLYACTATTCMPPPAPLIRFVGLLPPPASWIMCVYLFDSTATTRPLSNRTSQTRSFGKRSAPSPSSSFSARVESPGLSLAKRSMIISESSETFSVPSPIGTWRLEGAWRGEIQGAFYKYSRGEVWFRFERGARVPGRRRTLKTRSLIPFTLAEIRHDLDRSNPAGSSALGIPSIATARAQG